MTKQAQNLPRVSICTITYNRQHLLPQLEKCILAQDYPHALIDWIIVDDSENEKPPFRPLENSSIKTQYHQLPEKMIQGRKRNFSHTLCAGDIIVGMDDDDYYPPQRVSHAVEMLKQSGKLIAGTTILPIMFVRQGGLWISGPFGENHATAGTFAFRQELLKTQTYRNEDKSGVEKYFLNNFTVDMVQLDPFKTILCMDHGANTFDKRRLIQGGKNPRMRQFQALPEGFILDEERVLEEYRRLHLSFEN